MDASIGLTADEIRAIEWDCQKLSIMAFNRIDAREYEALGELYTEDATFVRPTDVENPFHGREAIVASYAGRPANRMSRHLCTNFEVVVEGPDRAKGFFLVAVYIGDSDKPAPRIGAQAESSQLVGEFRDEYVLTEAGWRISKRVGNLSMSTP